jgi:hypothetical protein
MWARGGGLARCCFGTGTSKGGGGIVGAAVGAGGGMILCGRLKGMRLETVVGNMRMGYF